MKPRTLAIALAAAPAVAHAHLTNTGFGPFYDGLTHLFVTPEDLLPVIALSLLAGLRGPRFGRAVLFALPVACLAGTLGGLVVHSRATVPAAMAVVTIAPRGSGGCRSAIASRAGRWQRSCLRFWTADSASAAQL